MFRGMNCRQMCYIHVHGTCCAHLRIGKSGRLFMQTGYKPLSAFLILRGETGGKVTHNGGRNNSEFRMQNAELYSVSTYHSGNNAFPVMFPQGHQ